MITFHHLTVDPWHLLKFSPDNSWHLVGGEGVVVVHVILLAREVVNLCHIVKNECEVCFHINRTVDTCYGETKTW